MALATELPTEPEEQKGAELTQEQITALLIQKIADLTAVVADLTSGAGEPAKKTVGKANSLPKSHVPSKPSPDRTYIRLLDVLPDYGKVPQQQADLAKIMVKYMEKGVKYPEKFVFDLVLEHAHEYPSLANSKMSADYVLRYYRDLDKKDGKHFGLRNRKFISHD